MALDIFTSQQSFQKNPADSSQGFVPKRDYETSIKKDEFKTSRSKREDLQQSEQNKNFANVMRSLKKRKSEINNKAQIAQNANERTIDNENKKVNAEKIDNKSAFQTQETALTSSIDTINNSQKSQDTIIDLKNIAALNAEIQKLIEDQTKNGNDTDQIIITSDTKPKEIDGLLSLISSFLKNPDDITNLSDNKQLKTIIEQIKNIVDSNDGGLVTLSLSPEELTKLQEIIQRHLKDETDKQDQKSLEALAANFTIVEPPAKQTDNNGASETKLQVVTEQEIQPLKSENYAQSRYDAKYDLRYDTKSGAGNQNIDKNIEKTDFKAALKNADSNAKPAANNDNNISSGQKFLQDSGLLAPNSENMLDLQTGQNLNIGALNNAATPLQSSATNVITQSQNASSAHPATQMVSATIQKAVKAGEDTTIKLRLDPPELGRVEVKMSIDKDNATKIVLTAEKPETYMLLKHDSAILQNALHNSGIDNNQSSIDFELASDNHDFNQNNKNQNNGNGNRNSASNKDDELIETTMDWRINPHTGRMHYNVLV